MKKLLIITFLFISIAVNATNYYIKNSGNDNSTGLSNEQAWATIAKVNSSFSSLSAGDQILFNRGDTFYGTIIISKSGISGNPIIIGAYGSGVDPVITGFTTISGWTDQGGNIYSKIITSEAQTNMVTIDGVNTGMGRYPDATYLTYESCATNTTITDTGLGDATDWAGAEIVIKKNDWTIDRCLVTDHTGDVLTYTNLGTTQNASANFGYFIQNDLRCVTTTNDWYHDIGTDKFYIYGNPAAKTVKVATVRNLVYNNGYDYITIDNLSFEGAITDAIYFGNNSDHYIIQNCTINFVAGVGIKNGGNYGTINNNHISNCAGAGLVLLVSGSHVNITNNTIINIGKIVGQSMEPGGYSGMDIWADNCLIQYNDIENIGYVGIAIAPNAFTATVKNNFINNVCSILNDGGGIYLSGPRTSVSIDGNIVLNAIGSIEGTPNALPSARAIHLDEFASHVTVTNNTVAQCAIGLLLQKAHDDIISNNTLFDNATGIMYANWTTSNLLYNNNVNDNIFFAKSRLQYVCKFSRGHNADSTNFITADNNYYARPFADNIDFYMNYNYGGRNAVEITLIQWKTFTAQDANSHPSPISISDTSKIDFYYNTTKTNKVTTLDQPMIDVKGTKYANSITLLPFTSVVLMVDPNPASPGIPVYTGSVIENATASLLEISYNVSLSNIVPSSSAFTVQVNSVVRTVKSVAISGNKVQLTLASPVFYGDVVLLSYIKPSSNPLQTATGGAAASISNQPVTNNCMNIVPSVVITSPIMNSSFTALANITITANATDADGSIIMVEFYNGSTKIGTTSTAPYSFTWNNVALGTYSLTVVATDNFNSKTISSAISISVNNGTTPGNKPPVIKISNPKKGNKFENLAAITIDADAYDPDGTITKVEFYSGTVKLFEVTSAPFTYTWKDVKAGNYTITAVATDNLNATTTSLPIEFEVGTTSKYDAKSDIINLYPNPNDGHFSIEFINPLQNEKSNIVITDLAGKEVYNGVVSKEETLKQIDLSYIKSGIYILMIIYQKILVTKKIIIH